MTLILTTLTTKGAVIAADRRMTATHKQTGAFTVLSDEVIKIFCGPDIAIARVGGYDAATQSPAKLIHSWLAQTYRPDLDFHDQMQSFWTDHFQAGDKGGFVAVAYRNHQAESFRFDGQNEPIYASVGDRGHAKLQLNGSGNQVAGRIIDQEHPSIAEMNLQQLAQLSKDIIKKTHTEMAQHQPVHVTVGSKCQVAVIDDHGAALLDV